jgi:acetyl esterase/lipase
MLYSSCKYALKQFKFNALALLILLCPMARGASPATQPGVKRWLPPHVTCLPDIQYGPATGKANLLDLYLPDDADQLDHPLPLIIWIHGGGWIEGNKDNCPVAPAVPFGFIGASLNYRLSGEAQYPAQIQDCKGAIRFLRAHAAEYHIDPNRIGVWGASAGGHLVALLGTSGGSTELEGTVGGNLDQSSKVQAVCDWFGPTDLTQFADQAKAADIAKFTPGPRLITALFGGTLDEKKDLVQLANPIAFLKGKTPADLPPFLIMHGDKDKMVPVAQSQMLDDALTALKVSVDFQIIPGAGHGNGFNTDAVQKSVLTFFEKNLK